MTDQSRRELWGSLGLVLASVLWGLSYPMTKYIETCPTMFIISIRFLTATVMLALVFFKKMKHINAVSVRYAFLLSGFIMLMYVLGIVGLKYTTAMKASFFSPLCFLVVPIINRVIFKKKISKIVQRSTFVCLIGMALFCYNKDMGALDINIGDLLCFGGAVSGAFHIVFVERVSKREDVDAAAFSILLMAFVALYGTVLALFRGEFDFTGVSALQIGIIMILGIFCSGVAFTLQTYLEAIVPANRAGVIFALEPVTGYIFSFLILGEILPLSGWIGAALIMAAVFYQEYLSNTGK